MYYFDPWMDQKKELKMLLKAIIYCNNGNMNRNRYNKQTATADTSFEVFIKERTAIE